MQVSHYEDGPADARRQYLIIRINQGIPEVKRIFLRQSGIVYPGLASHDPEIFSPEQFGNNTIIRIRLDIADQTSQTAELLYDLAYSESHGRIEV